jgi:hypothetical protein
MAAVVPVEHLQALASVGPKQEQGAVRRDDQPASFDLEAFIKQHLEVHHEGAWSNGGYRWILKGCPFNSDHTELSAYVARRSSGAIVAGCQHYSCTWGWGELREQFAPKPAATTRRKRGTDDAPPIDEEPTPSTQPQPPAEPKDLGEVLATFRRWLDLPDPGPLYVILATVAANLMRGDPIWLLLVGAPGSGKTELLLSIIRLAHVHQAATLTEPALLSGTPAKDKAKGAKGGLLREIGSFGIVLCKDFGSVLSMHRESRGLVLAALREIYDGNWTRHLGVDGGRKLHWEGKLGIIGGVTPSIDGHHAVMAGLGERFALYQLPMVDERTQARRAIAHAGQKAPCGPSSPPRSPACSPRSPCPTPRPHSRRPSRTG